MCKAAVGQTLLSAVHFTLDRNASIAYIVERMDDAEDMLKQMEKPGGLPYAACVKHADGTRTVNGLVCIDNLCAVAYILARWW